MFKSLDFTALRKDRYKKTTCLIFTRHPQYVLAFYWQNHAINV